MNRLIKLPCWWTDLFDESIMYLFVNDDGILDIGSRTRAIKHKWEFTDAEVDELRQNYTDFDKQFLVEKPRAHKRRSNDK